MKSPTPSTSPAAPPGVLELAVDARGALDAAIDGARLASPVIVGIDGRNHVMLPNGYQLKDITDPHRVLPRPMQRVTVDDRASLTAYANRFRTEASLIVADYDAGTISVHVDWHPHNEHEDHGFAGPLNHTCTLKILPSEEFTRWNAFEGKLHGQAEFAAFLEENSIDIAFPEAATMVEISRDLEATQSLSFKSSTRLETGDRSFRFETDTRVENNVVVPREFMLNIPLFNGERPVELKAAFRFRPTGAGLQLGFEWRRVEYQRRAYFAEIATLASDETGLPVIMGRAH